jgi:hypothetical protein
VDGDLVGFPADEDCADNDKAIYPGVDEPFDAQDKDCDGQIDKDIQVGSLQLVVVVDKTGEVLAPAETEVAA